jgi:tetratricopeptide (TPR) repeat protein
MAPPRDFFRVAHNRFVDRETQQKLFEDAVFAIPPDRSNVCVFYGIGGQGKTALCRVLFRKLDPAVEPSYKFVRRAEVDLHDRSKSDPDLLLVWIRNSFVKSGVELPAFDLALAIVWESTRPEQPFPKLIKPWLGRITEGADLGVDEGASAAVNWLKSDEAIHLFGELVGEIPGLGFLLKKGGKWAIDKTKKAYLLQTREALRTLYVNGELKQPYELSQILPWILAQDLNFYISRHSDNRLVLLIDEYERLFDEGGAGSRWNENPLDRNIRTLIQYANGMLVTFFLRERLPWETDPDWREDLENSQHFLGGLDDKDAEAYLVTIPISDPEIRQAIIAGARETSESDAFVYPLLLDLLVAHWRFLSASGAVVPGQFNVAAKSFAPRRREIVSRVLRDYGLPLQKTLERISVAHRFDRPAFDHMVQAFGTALPLDQFQRISELSFVTKSEDGFLTIHNAISETLRETLTPDIRRTSIEALFSHFEERANVNSVTTASIAALSEASYLRWAQGVDGYAEWLRQRTTPLRLYAKFPSVTSLWRDAARRIGDSVGDKHPDTATALDILGVLLWDQGDRTGALPLLERALETREQALGPEHAETATSLVNVAGLLHAQGNLALARPLYERALVIRQEELGEEHLDTATSLDKLGLLLHTEGDRVRARTLFERALAIRENAACPDDLDTASSLNNLGVLLWDQGDRTHALPLLERALAIREQVLGQEHSTTITSLANIAGLRYSNGDLVEALRLSELALTRYETALGPEHPYTSRLLLNIAAIMFAQGKNAGVRERLEKAVAINEKALGLDHPDTAMSLTHLGVFLSHRGEISGARSLFKRALEVYSSTFGPESPRAVQVRTYLGRIP